MREEWRDIKGYEGLYQISNLGRVHSYYKRDILEPKEDKGYLRVGLYKNGKRKPYSIHRLVAEAFIPNPNNYPQVNHKDEDKSNNRVSNLEWCTAKYNINYGTHNKRMSESRKGSKHTEDSKNKISNTRKEKGLSKGSKNPKAHKVECITAGRKFNCIKEAGEYYSINTDSITKCCQGKLKSAGKHPVTGEKLVWKYID